MIVGIDSPREVLTKSVADLRHLLRIAPDQAEEILAAASKQAYHWQTRERTGNSLEATAVLTTGNDMIDKVLNHGIPLGTLTEVVGER